MTDVESTKGIPAQTETIRKVDIGLKTILGKGSEARFRRDSSDGEDGHEGYREINIKRDLIFPRLGREHKDTYYNRRTFGKAITIDIRTGEIPVETRGNNLVTADKLTTYRIDKTISGTKIFINKLTVDDIYNPQPLPDDEPLPIPNIYKRDTWREATEAEAELLSGYIKNLDDQDRVDQSSDETPVEKKKNNIYTEKFEQETERIFETASKAGYANNTIAFSLGQEVTMQFSKDDANKPVVIIKRIVDNKQEETIKYSFPFGTSRLFAEKNVTSLNGEGKRVIIPTDSEDMTILFESLGALEDKEIQKQSAQRNQFITNVDSIFTNNQNRIEAENTDISKIDNLRIESDDGTMFFRREASPMAQNTGYSVVVDGSNKIRTLFMLSMDSTIQVAQFDNYGQDVDDIYDRQYRRNATADEITDILGKLLPYTN